MNRSSAGSFFWTTAAERSGDAVFPEERSDKKQRWLGVRSIPRHRGSPLEIESAVAACSLYATRKRPHPGPLPRGEGEFFLRSGRCERAQLAKAPSQRQGPTACLRDEAVTAHETLELHSAAAVGPLSPQSSPIGWERVAAGRVREWEWVRERAGQRAGQRARGDVEHGKLFYTQNRASDPYKDEVAATLCWRSPKTGSSFRAVRSHDTPEGSWSQCMRTIRSGLHLGDGAAAGWSPAQPIRDQMEKRDRGTGSKSQSRISTACCFRSASEAFALWLDPFHHQSPIICIRSRKILAEISRRDAY